MRDHGRCFLARSVLLCLRSIPSLLRLLTAHNAAGSGYNDVAKVKEYRKVSRLIPGTKAKRSIVKFVAAM